MRTRKKYLLIGVLIIILIVQSVLNQNINSNADVYYNSIQSTYNLYNDKSTSTKTLNELESAFKSNSVKYKKIDITYESESLNYDIYDQQLTEINNNITEGLVFINNYTEQRNEYVKVGDALNAQISQGYIDKYAAQVNTLKLNQIEVKLKRDTSQFYKDNKAYLIREAQKSLEIDFKKKCLSLILYKEQIEYYQATEKYLYSLLNIEKTKYKKGYSTITSVEDLEAQLANVLAEISNLSNLKNQVLSDIKVETTIFGSFDMKLELETVKKDFTNEEVNSLFSSRNYEIIRLTKLANSYQTYIKELKEVYDEFNPVVKQIELKEREINLDAHISNNKINTLANEALDQYNYTYEAVKAKDKSVLVSNKKYMEITKQYEKGKVAQIDVYKVEMEQEQVEAEYYKLYCDYIIWNEIITTVVPGQRP